jgi:PAS domain S-box-containing protein
MRGVQTPPAPDLVERFDWHVIADCQPDALLITTNGGRVLYVNRAAEQLFGRSAARLAASNLLALVHEADRTRLVSLFLDLVVHPTVQPTQQVRVRGPEGTLRWTEWRGATLAQAPAGDLLLFTCRDFSSWWPATEEAGPAAAQTVPSAVVATLSHDLKNPLAAIKAHAQLLARRTWQLQQPQGAAFAEGLDAIDGAVEKTLVLLDDLLDAAQLQAGQSLQLERQEVDLLALLARVVQEQQATATPQQLVLEAELPALRGAWDPLRLERVFENLLSNAIKYSPASSAIVVRVAREADAACVTVADSGIGIPAADVSHVFDWFYRGSNVGEQQPGTGIGLAGARQIVELHGGSISVASTEGQGTTFTVQLPLDGRSEDGPADGRAGARQGGDDGRGAAERVGEHRADYATALLCAGLGDYDCWALGTVHPHQIPTASI